MSSLPIVPLPEIVDIHDYLREPVSQTERNKREGPFPYFGATGQVGWIDDYRQDGKYVLLGEDGAPFLDPQKPKAYVVEGKCWVNNHAHVLKGKDGICDDDFLCFALNWADYSDAVTGSTRLKLPQNTMNRLLIPKPPIEKQRQIAARLKAQLAEVDKARQAAEAQLRVTTKLADAIVFDSIRSGKTTRHNLGEVLEEVKRGIGPTWADYPVLGATRDGLAPAREAPGKHAPKYKPVFPGTVFYNPMRILIGSIALVDDDDAPGITSPDYVALRGKKGVVDSRWFYYWLRSPLGEQCILSLARGAVRERMLFNRLAEGEIELPDFTLQQKASMALAALKPMRQAIESTINDINLLPRKILEQAFEG
jgi:type I restriction enzyme S subunit